jgi:hypothetical protein
MASMWTSAAVPVATGCNGGACQETDACPAVDQPATPGDLDLPLEPGSLVDFTIGGTTSTQELAGGELVVAPSACPDPDSCTMTVKRLSFRFIPFTLSYSGAATGTVDVEGTVISFEAPLTLTGSVNGFSLPAGTMVDTCSTIDGRSWHASAALAGTQDVLWVFPPYSAPDAPYATFDGTIPVVLRAGDPHCTRQAFEASFVATARGGGGADGGTSNDAGAADR